MEQQVKFAFGEVVIVAADPTWGNAGPAFSRWPCPGCGERQLLDDAWTITVRNADGPAQERKVLVCAGCAARTGVAGGGAYQR